ncbi:MAG: DNA cytosine methyltransferase [Candidatus Kapaibacteriota bacterium]
MGEKVRGLTNWNGGLVFDEVQSDLEAQGYEVTPFLLPACAVNAPHRRDRIWFVAYSNLHRSKQRNGNNEVNTSQGRFDALSNTNESNGNGDAPNTNSRGLEGSTEVGWDSKYVER